MKEGVSIRGIYKITNIVNNKIYIGQTNDINVRWQNHKNQLNGNRHVNTHLQNAWNKYGEDNFQFQVIYYANETDNLNLIERELINKCNSNVPDFGYNMTNGGEGYTLSDEVKQKMSLNGRGKNTTLSFEDVSKIKILMSCNVDRKEISKMFNVSVKVLTNISIGATFNYILPELNDKIHNLKQKNIDNRNQFILELYDCGYRICDISKEFGFTESVVEKCIYKYRKINKNYKIRKISKDEELEIVRLYNKGGENTITLSKKYGVSSTTISSILYYYNIAV